VVFDDLPALKDQTELSKLRKPHEFYESFTRCYAPILAGNLVARLDGRPLEFRCVKHGYILRDEDGNPLDHLRCDFVFQAEPPAADRVGLGPRTLTLKEGNYELEEGQIRLSLAATDSSIKLLSKTEPDAKLKTLPATQLEPGNDARLRQVEATFLHAPANPADAEAVEAPSSATVQEAAVKR